MIVTGDFREYECPRDAALVLCDVPFGIKKVYGGVQEKRSFTYWVKQVVEWSTAPWTVIVGPHHTMYEWLHTIPKPDRIIYWSKTFAQIRKNSTWQQTLSPLLVYKREGAPWYYPGGTIPDCIVCCSSMSDIRLTKYFFRGTHPGVTGTPIASEIIRPLTFDRDLVVDPMCGIASTLIAAQRLGRRTMGFEIVEDYAKAGRAWMKAEKTGVWPK